MTKSSTLRRGTVLSVAVALLLGNTLALQGAPKAPATTGLAIPVAGVATGGTFQGTANITSFAVNAAGHLVAVGTLTGVVKDVSGNVVQSILATFSTPIATPLVPPQQASCSILHLVLGPINLDLLGLVIQTNQIVVDIRAVPGPGNLLGNLLCSVANLLNGGLNLQAVANQLNQIIGTL